MTAPTLAPDEVYDWAVDELEDLMAAGVDPCVAVVHTTTGSKACGAVAEAIVTLSCPKHGASSAPLCMEHVVLVRRAQGPNVVRCGACDDAGVYQPLRLVAVS